MNNKIYTFDKNALEYDSWFDKYKFAYQSELDALRRFVPKQGLGIEIGTGTGRFSIPLSITIGVEPSHGMAEIALSRGISVHNTRAENLPFCEGHFDYALMVTTLCFLDKPESALKNICKIIRNSGQLIIGIIDKSSYLGRSYEARKVNDKFYRHAQFYSVDEVLQLLETSGFIIDDICQTIFSKPQTMTAPDPVIDGYGEGSFVVINSVKSTQKKENKNENIINY